MGVTPTGLLGQNAPSHVGEGFRKGPGPVPTHPKRDTARTVVLSDHLKKRTSAIQMIAVSLRLKKKHPIARDEKKGNNRKVDRSKE